jgi:hypothetical protein
MPNPGLEKPIRKVTLNLWERDYEVLKAHYGVGYTTVIRDLVEDHAQGIARATPKTIGDLA